MNNIQAWELILMKNVDIEKYIGDGGLGFLLSLSFYLHPYRNFLTKLTKIMGRIFSTKALVFMDKIFMTENS